MLCLDTEYRVPLTQAQVKSKLDAEISPSEKIFVNRASDRSLHLVINIAQLSLAHNITCNLKEYGKGYILEIQYALNDFMTLGTGPMHPNLWCENKKKGMNK